MTVLETQGLAARNAGRVLAVAGTAAKNAALEAAAKAIGIPPRSYQRLEQDGNKTHYDTLMKIADCYGVSVDWLMGRTDVRSICGKE